MFHNDTGCTLEVGHEAYKLLAWLKTHIEDARVLCRQKGVRAIMPALLALNIIERVSEPVLGASDEIFTQNALESSGDQFSTELRISPVQHLTAPETIHLAITYACGKGCPDCYARPLKALTDQELNTSGMLKIIDILADNGVFQLAIGGGEPFMRPDVCDIIKYADYKGLVVHVTTGRYVLPSRQAEVLNHIKSLHIGIQAEKAYS